MENIRDFDRQIKGIITSCNSYFVGGDKVTSIKRYEENGQESFVAWYAVYRGSEIVARINGAHVIEVQH